MKVSRKDAIKILWSLIDQDGWEYVVEDYYDEVNDDVPSGFDVLEALGITEKEVIKSILN